MGLGPWSHSTGERLRYLSSSLPETLPLRIPGSCHQRKSGARKIYPPQRSSWNRQYPTLPVNLNLLWFCKKWENFSLQCLDKSWNKNNVELKNFQLLKACQYTLTYFAKPHLSVSLTILAQFFQLDWQLWQDVKPFTLLDLKKFYG